MATDTTYLYDGHGHSVASDGLNKADAIVKAAVAHGLNIVGLSDHNSVDSLRLFLKTADELNRDQLKILAVPSVEVTTRQGDVLVAVPDRHHAENLIANYIPYRKKPDACDAIQHYVTEYNAVCVLLHPVAKFVRGMTIESIEDILASLPAPIQKNVGVEINNWMSQVFFWKRQRIEADLKVRNKVWQLAEFSFTDYHLARDVGKGNTAITMSELSAQALIKAVQQRQTKVHTKTSNSMIEIVESMIGSGVADILSHTRTLNHAED